jgi:biopolymer transport protein ExbD
MAEIIQNEEPKKGRRRPKNHMRSVDMTPMVDLACLLLTFFMLTTIFVKPKVMDIVLPSEGASRPIPGDRTVTIILDENNSVYWYNGLADPTKGDLPTLNKSSFNPDGIRKMLLTRNRELFLKINGTAGNKKNILNLKRKDTKGPIVLIKASDKVKYGNMVDVIDELAICQIASYAIVKLTPVEKEMLGNVKKAGEKKVL